MEEYRVNFTLWLERYLSNGTGLGQMPEPPGYLLGVWTLFYIVIFGVGLFGNTAVTVVVLRCRTMRTSINFLFLNLCIADLLVLLISGPTAVMDMYAKEAWYLGGFMCKYEFSLSEQSKTYTRTQKYTHISIYTRTRCRAELMAMSQTGTPIIRQQYSYDIKESFEVFEEKQTSFKQFIFSIVRLFFL